MVEGHGPERAAVDLVEKLPVTSVGFIEPRCVECRLRCSVCDGFVGNVMLKTAEATATLLGVFFEPRSLVTDSAWRLV